MSNKWFRLSDGSQEEMNAIEYGFLEKLPDGGYASLVLLDLDDPDGYYGWIRPEKGSLCRINDEHHDLEVTTPERFRMFHEFDSEYFINLSNHPSDKWSSEQMEDAEKYGEVVDYPFPAVSVYVDDKGIADITQDVICDIVDRYGRDITVMCQGQTALMCSLNEAFGQEGIPCVVSTTRKELTEEKDANGRSIQNFVYSGMRYSNEICRTPHRSSPHDGPVINYAPCSSDSWSEAQREVTGDDVIDMKSPIVPAEAKWEDIDALAHDELDKILAESPSAVVLSTEGSLSIRLAELLEDNDVKAVAALSEPIELPPDKGGVVKKIPQFEFKGYLSMNNFPDVARARYHDDDGLR